jgi:hypothetical protein
MGHFKQAEAQFEQWWAEQEPALKLIYPKADDQKGFKVFSKNAFMSGFIKGLEKAEAVIDSHI